MDTSCFLAVLVHKCRAKVGHRLRRAARRVAPAAAAMAALIGAEVTATAQTTLADVKSIQCTFTRQATGRWTQDGAPETSVRPSSLVLRFEGIDTETGTAQLRNGAMTTDVIVRLAEGYLHLMQAFRTGPCIRPRSSRLAPAPASSGRRILAMSCSRHLCPAQPQALNSITAPAKPASEVRAVHSASSCRAREARWGPRTAG